MKNLFHNLYERETKDLKPNQDLKAMLEEQFKSSWKERLTALVQQPLAVGFAGVAAITLILVATQGPGPGTISGTITESIRTVAVGDRVDDWAYSPAGSARKSTGLSGGGPNSMGSVNACPTCGAATGLGSSSFLGLADMAFESAAPVAQDQNIGLAVGGSNDINSFRDNISNNYLPQPTDITYEGLFYEYTFDTGAPEVCDDLFCPSYARAVSADPISGDEEYYLSVGLNSGIKESDFERKNLNLVVVLDISGSMRSEFNRYYYDGTEKEGDWNKSKMEVATESIAALTTHLEEGDRLGIVLFDGEAYEAKPLNLVGETDMGAIRRHIMEIQPQGSTNMEAGMQLAQDLLAPVAGEDPSAYESRIIFLTDAMPNTGGTGRNHLLGLTEGGADDGIYSTFIGIGIDFQSELINEITQVEGANYYSVHSPEDFAERMDDGFDYMVTPLVFDLDLSFDAEDWEIEEVYGSPEADEATGQLMHINTLFPSERSDGESRGGIVLLKLNRTGSNPEIALTASYRDRAGDAHSTKARVAFDKIKPEHFDHSGIHKAVLLSRWADLLKSWSFDERRGAPEPGGHDPIVTLEEGIPSADIMIEGEHWEQRSYTLTLSNHYRTFFDTFRSHLKSEMQTLNDPDLQQELDLLNELLSDAPTPYESGNHTPEDDWHWSR